MWTLNDIKQYTGCSNVNNWHAAAIKGKIFSKTKDINLDVPDDVIQKLHNQPAQGKKFTSEEVAAILKAGQREYMLDDVLNRKEPEKDCYTQTQLATICNKHKCTILEWIKKAIPENESLAQKHLLIGRRGTQAINYTRDEVIAILTAGKQTQKLDELFGITDYCEDLDAPPLTDEQQKMVLDSMNIVYYHANRFSLFYQGDYRDELVAEGLYYLCYVTAKYFKHQNTDYWKKYVSTSIKRHYLRVKYRYDEKHDALTWNNWDRATQQDHVQEIIKNDILATLPEQQKEIFYDVALEIPQTEMAEKYNCSVWTIGARVNEMKEMVLNTIRMMQLECLAS